jgi:hypothetical protein
MHRIDGTEFAFEKAREILDFTPILWYSSNVLCRYIISSHQGGETWHTSCFPVSGSQPPTLLCPFSPFALDFRFLSKSPGCGLDGQSRGFFVSHRGDSTVSLSLTLLRI